MINHHFIEPIDTLILRSNKLFGEAGNFAASQTLPWPSVLSGSIRSAIMARDKMDFTAFAQSKTSHPNFGSYCEPGNFLLCAFGLMRRMKNGGYESIHKLPADVVVAQDSAKKFGVVVRQAKPTRLHSRLSSSAATAASAVLAEPTRSKAMGQFWLTQKGWQQYLNGEEIAEMDLVPSADLWATDTKVGIGLDPSKRSAMEGKLFTTESIVFKRDTGFYTSTQNADLSGISVLRLGGDGRAANIKTADGFVAPATPYVKVMDKKRFKIVLTSPGLFEKGWLPTGTNEDMSFNLHGVTGKLVCAVVPRSEVISGFDLVKRAPKNAERFAPVGSVYWLEDVSGSVSDLGKLAENGLWLDSQHNMSRRSEGFNRIAIATY
jgi:CRISPR-associated protein Cmr3